jgi:hypothetical protein
MSEPTFAEGSGGHSARAAAWVLIAGPLLEVAAMAHHPSVHAHEAADVVAQLRALSDLAALVHGVLIALMAAILLALLEFSVRRNLSRPLVRSGLLAYGLGVIAMTGAALVGGFVAPAVAHVNPGVTAADLQQTVAFLSFAMLVNQALAPCGAILMSVGIVAWSLDLRRGPLPQRLLGYFGIVSGLGAALALAGGLLRLNVHGMTLVTVLQGLWTVGAGLLLLRRTSTAPAAA